MVILQQKLRKIKQFFPINTRVSEDFYRIFPKKNKSIASLLIINQLKE